MVVDVATEPDGHFADAFRNSFVVSAPSVTRREASAPSIELLLFHQRPPTTSAVAFISATALNVNNLCVLFMFLCCHNDTELILEKAEGIDSCPTENLCQHL